jgi:hypothetical protein
LFRIGAIDYECGQLNKRGRKLIGVPAGAARPDWLTEAKTVIIRHGTDRALALKEIGCTKREIKFICKQSNTGNPIYPDGWWGQYTRPEDAANDWSSFTPVEFVPPALMSHATTFVSTLANILEVLIDRNNKGAGGARNFRVALHRLTRFDGKEVFQQITPYAGRIPSKAGVGRYFSVEGGIVGLACKTGTLVVAQKRDTTKFNRIWKLTHLQQSGAKRIKSYVGSLLACPFFAPERKGSAQHVSMVLFVDASEAAFFDKDVRETIAAACRGFVSLLEDLQASGALRPMTTFYRGFKVKRGSKNTRLIAEIRSLGVSFTNSEYQKWKSSLTFKSVNSLEFEIGTFMRSF